MRYGLGAALVALLMLTGCGDEARPGAPSTDGVGTNNGAATNNGAETNNGEDGPAQRVLPPGPWSAEAYGYYGVGATSTEVSTTASDGEARQFRVAIWYPTLDEDAARPDGTGPAARIDATVALTAPAPVMVFSHGSGGFPEQSTFLTDFFVSHGWIVVAPSHKGNDVIGQPIDVRFFMWRPEDISATLDHVQALPAEHRLHGLLSDDVVVAGHSFGGYTALALAGARFDLGEIRARCRSLGICGWLDAGAEGILEGGFEDPRFKLAIALAPAGSRIFYGGVSETQIPVLLVTAGGDQTLPNDVEGDLIWEAMDGPDDVRLNIISAGHYSFTDLCASLGSFFADDGCGPAFTPAARVHGWVNTYGLAFVRVHLFGDATDADLIDGTRRLASGMIVNVK